MEQSHRQDKSGIVGFIGGYLIDQGVLSLEGLDQALKRQIELANQGRALPLDRILVEMGFASEAEVKLALARQAADLGQVGRMKRGSRGLERKRRAG
jgi:hypothetical protein